MVLGHGDDVFWYTPYTCLLIFLLVLPEAFLKPWNWSLLCWKRNVS